MNHQNVRVRFAPSPTGFLHIGGARTALFNWLYARHCGGTFILRIEDTDAARNTREAVEVILNGLRWLGLDWDEGPVTGEPDGPSRGCHGSYFQSKRVEIYRQRARELLDRGAAYQHEGAIKFRMERDPIVIEDLVVGKVRRELTDREELDPDFVIVRSDGQPIFHFVNVVDDIEMGVTHVIRGEDHLSNTPKHLALFRAFGSAAPAYAHIPLILNPDGTKMSKRDSGASMASYMEGGYLPEAVANYLCLLGWSPKENREIMEPRDVVALFDLPQVLRHNARFDVAKLNWMNWEYIKLMAPDRFLELGLQSLSHAGIETAGFDPAYIRAALSSCKEKVKLLTDIPAFADFYFRSDFSYAPEARNKDFAPANRPGLEKLREALSDAPDFSASAIEAILKKAAADLGVKAGALVHPTRLACTGRTVGPSLYHLIEILGKSEVLKRLDRALAQF